VKPCTTHHNACDCREAAIEAEFGRLRELRDHWIGEAGKYANLADNLERRLNVMEADRDWWRNQARVLADLAARNNPVSVTVAPSPSDEFP